MRFQNNAEAAAARQLQEKNNKINAAEVNTEATAADEEGGRMGLYIVLFGVVAVGGGGAFVMMGKKKNKGGLGGAHWD